jgi:primosomal protein N'
MSESTKVAMKVVSVIPLKPGPLRGDLTYFSSLPVSTGGIVAIPLRGKKILGIAVSVEDAASLKSDIKEMSFDLRKVIEVKESSIFRPEYLESVIEIGKYFGTSKNNALTMLIPAVFRDGYDTILEYYLSGKAQIVATSAGGKEIKKDKLLFQEKLEDRVSAYKTLIRETFALKKSVFIVLPTEQDVKIFYELLSRGIEQFIFTLHGGMSKKNILEEMRGVLNTAHGILILGTAPYLSTPRGDIGVVILEHEGSPAYRTIQRPHIDLRLFTELFASKLKAKLILADSLLRFETLARKETENLSSIYPISFRTNFEGTITVLPKKRSGTKEFTVLSDKSMSAIRSAVERGENVFVFSLRKGLATMTVCRDCGDILSCDKCKAPVVLFQKNDSKKRIFICNRCGREMPSDTICHSCGGWNLVPLGIGTDTVYEEIRKNFPKLKVYKLDKESVKTKTQAKKIAKEFAGESGAVLVGTEMAFFYLKTDIPFSLVASFDSLWSIPNFKMSEKVVNLLLSILKKTKSEVIIETKNVSDAAILAVKSGNLAAFVREELEIRKKLGYPPFKRFIKVSFLGDKENTSEVRKMLPAMFKEYEPDIFSGFHPKLKGKYVTNMLIKLEPKDWSLTEILPGSQIDQNLLAKMESLPPGFEVAVDPEDLL